ncbi:MAG: ABC transporter substrate-binding protein [Hydrogenophaga sp.]|uniref:ABC transporter substrate-binding protein n=1 Tax=Hydrogenophaga sp. TaxID=1904254 RepID=UPI0026139C1F|nr:ABC transporter substrate-binding protein [Hydrogenophaga sp.]MDM7942147.1 ABC transporter substrate-binding protein [Hydrogenophaga sp.]
MRNMHGTGKLKAGLTMALMWVFLPLSLAVQAEDGVTPKQILIGQTLTLQSGTNDYGVAVSEGVSAALDQVNRAGGVLGRQVVLNVLDDDNKAALAETNARRLVTQDKVFLLFGPIEGGPSTAVMKVAVEQNVPLFGPMAGSPTLRTPHQPLVFPVRAEHKEEFRALMAQARSLGMQRLAFVRSDSSTGELHLENARRIALALGMELVADLPFKSDIDAAGIDALARQLASTRAQMVFNHGGIGVYEKLIRQAHSIGVKARFYGVNSGSTQLADHLGPLGQGMVFAQVLPSPWERKTGITRAYQEAFSRFKPGRAFSYGSLEGYLTGRALTEALRRAGPTPTRASFLAGLRNADLDIEGIRISYRDGEHAGMTLVDLSIVTREGKFRH